MRHLLDTHVLLWYGTRDPRLDDRLVDLLDYPTSRLCVSMVSLWEMAIKENLGKLKLAGGYTDWVQENILEQPFDILTIHHKHLSRCSELPLHHRDPFDRMLVCQALEGRMALVSKDKVFQKYEGLNVVW